MNGGVLARAAEAIVSLALSCVAARQRTQLQREFHEALGGGIDLWRGGALTGGRSRWRRDAVYGLRGRALSPTNPTTVSSSIIRCRALRLGCHIVRGGVNVALTAAAAGVRSPRASLSPPLRSSTELLSP